MKPAAGLIEIDRGGLSSGYGQDNRKQSLGSAVLELDCREIALMSVYSSGERFSPDPKSAFELVVESKNLGEDGSDRLSNDGLMGGMGAIGLQVGAIAQADDQAVLKS